MSGYLDNLKWLVSSPNSNKSGVVENKKNEDLDSGSDSESPNHSDSDLEYDKITVGLGESNKKNSESNKKNSQGKKKQLDSDCQQEQKIRTQSDYSQIYSDLIKKEQLVRESLDPDTVDKIKANYTEYLDSEVQIIKDFAGIMENFVHIKEQLKNFELDIKEFEQNIRTSNLAQISENKSELDEKINLIDKKIEELSGLMNGTNGLVNNYIDKITQLENSIKENETHRQEIMSRLEKFDKEHVELKNNSIKFLTVFTDYQKHFALTNNNSSNWINYLSWSLFSVGVGFGIKYLVKNFIGRK